MDIDKAVMIVDTIGQLAKIYRYAKFAYVGGAMKKNGLHNTLEPAAYGIPVVIGKYFNRFQEAIDMEKKGGISSVQTPIEFEKISNALMNDEKIVQQMGSINKNHVKAGKGASQRIIEKIKKHAIE